MGDQVVQNVLKLCNISFGYGKQSILHGVNLEVKAGEFIGLIGPNGGGKTTLLKIILGLLKPTAGAVTLLGGPPQRMRLQVGYVPQVMHFDRHFPISTLEITLGGRLAGLRWHGRFNAQDIDAAKKALQLVGLAGFERKPFAQLSGGQAQRALIARALATNNLQLLILDEPTANIDAQGEEQIYALLKALKSHLTIMMVTHDLQTALSAFDRVFCVHRMVAALDAQQVCEHYALGLYHAPLIDKAPCHE